MTILPASPWNRRLNCKIPRQTTSPCVSIGQEKRSLRSWSRYAAFVGSTNALIAPAGRDCKTGRPHASAVIRRSGGHDELLFRGIGGDCERSSMRNAGRSFEGSRAERLSRADSFLLLIGMQEEIRSQSSAVDKTWQGVTPSSAKLSRGSCGCRCDQDGEIHLSHAP